MRGKHQAFLVQHGWGEAAMLGQAGDASTRHYTRLRHRQGQQALLMDWPSGAPIPGMEAYSHHARLATHFPPFIAITHWLRGCGLSAPNLLAADAAQGLALVEDLGQEDYRDLLAGNDAALTEKLIRLALDVLLVIARQPTPHRIAYEGGEYAPAEFSLDVFLTEVGLFADVFLPATARGEFSELWRGLFHQLAADKPCLILRDFHSPNLLYLPKRRGVARVGLIDYQDALLGGQLYDVVSLLQDARQTIDPTHARVGLAYYARGRRAQGDFISDDALARDVAILGSQRLLKIFAIFERLRQQHGKTTYQEHLPRLETYLAGNFHHPVLHPFRDWLSDVAADFVARLTMRDGVST